MPAKGYRLKPRKLTIQEALRFLGAVKRNPSSPVDLLIFKIMAECGLKIGEIVGDPDGKSKLDGIRCEDLIGADQIFIRRALHKERKGIKINPQLMRELRECAGTRKSGKLFENLWAVPRGKKHPVQAMNKRAKDYAREASILDWNYLTTEWLRNTLSQNTVELVNFDSDISDEAIRTSDFYTLNYCLENSIRRLVRDVLSKTSNWWTENVPKSVREYAEDIKRREEESEMSSERIDILDYIGFGHLRDVIEQNWNNGFSERFIHGKSKRPFDALVDLNQIRPLIAHSVQLSPSDETKFRNAINEWFRVLKPLPIPPPSKRHYRRHKTIGPVTIQAPNQVASKLKKRKRVRNFLTTESLTGIQPTIAFSSR